MRKKKRFRIVYQILTVLGITGLLLLSTYKLAFTRVTYMKYILTLINLGSAVILSLEFLQMKVILDHIRFMKLYRGRACIWLLLSGFLVDNGEIATWSNILSIIFLSGSVYFAFAAFLCENEEYFSKSKGQH